MPNRLAQETSPYLLQHAQNPVDWYPWGPEALARARDEDKPIFLSIGYAACHWCHVMERESFEDEATAAFLNEHFVAIKVDREERPDLDSIYMDAVVAITGQGGWPMSVFLTPDGVPVFGGTYYPPEPRYGMPSFRQVMEAIASAWRDERAKILGGAEQLREALRRPAGRRDPAEGGSAGPSDAPAADVLRRELLEKALGYLSRAFDRRSGGFGGAPKFPQPMVLEFLLRSAVGARGEAKCGDGVGGGTTCDEGAGGAADDAARRAADESLRIVTRTLDKMARGGIYDQLGGGFHRYSVDDLWLVPHFEKMLYDNAQLASLYLHAWQVTGSELYRRVATETLDYVLREMTWRGADETGRELVGFFSSQDADSRNAAGELEEGAFFTWTPEEIDAALGGGEKPVPAADVRLFDEAYGVTQNGNFEGRTILHGAIDPDVLAERHGLTVEDVEGRLEAMRRRLFATREHRPAPARDDKVLSAWNGLMLAAFAEAARVLGRDDYRVAAEANAAFLLETLRDGRGRPLRTWKDGGTAKLNGYLDDYADLAHGLLQLYQTSFDERWFVAARELADEILAHFIDPAGGYFATSDDHEELLRRPRSEEDNAIPSGGAMATLVLLQLAAYTGDERYAAAAERALQAVADDAATMPLGFAQWLVALDLYLAPPVEVAIVGEELETRDSRAADAAQHPADPDEPSLLAVIRSTFRPHVVVAAAPLAAAPCAEDTAVPLLAQRGPVDGRPTAYLCHHFRCDVPCVDPGSLLSALAKR